jgi:hypothetical protein
LTGYIFGLALAIEEKFTAQGDLSSCGREYWTNRSTSLCFDCEKS